MRVYYSQKENSLNLWPDLANMCLEIIKRCLPYGLVLLIYPIFIWNSELDVKMILTLLALIPVALMMRKLRGRVVGRLMLVSQDGKGLFLLSEMGHYASTLSQAQTMEEDLIRVGVIPPEAREIEKTLFLRQIGRYILVRCSLRDEMMPRFFLFHDDFKNYQYLIWEFEERLQDKED